VDHGKIIAQGTPAELKKKSKTKTLEDAFIKLTGKSLRDEDASDIESLRNQKKMWRR
jgi:ABC-2 type transport system ATP-binding protein